MGFTTSFRMGQLLRYSVNIPEQSKDKDDYEYLVTDFIDSIQNTFKEKKFEKGGQFLFGYNKKLYSVHEDFQVGKNVNNFNAVGCGADIALGSLYSTKHMKNPIERLTLALEAAAHLSAGVVGPFTFVSSK